MGKISRASIPLVVNFMQEEMVDLICDTCFLEGTDEYLEYIIKKANDLSEAHKQDKLHEFATDTIIAYLTYIDKQWRAKYTQHKGDYSIE